MGNFLKGFFIGFGLMLFFLFGLVATKAYTMFINSEKISFQRQVEASKKVAFDGYISYPKFNASKALSTKESLSEEEKSEITSTFAKVLAKVKEYGICEGGSYMLEPNIAYKDGMSYPNGYRFDSNFECRFSYDDYEKYQNLLKDLNEILSVNNFINLNIPAIRSIVSENAMEKLKEDLYDNLFEQANNLAAHYSELKNKTCYVLEINFDANRYSNRALYSDIAYSIPIEKDTKQTLNANVKFECK